jgi:DNA-binding NarL/FixJ family response regulator
VNVPKLILIVDDSPAVRKATRLYFETETKFEVCGEAVDGIDALNKAVELKPDLVVLDLAMPRMNGLEAARELKRIQGDTRVVLFTSYADAVRELDLMTSGVHAVVSKADPLAKQIEDLLSR